MTSLARLWNSWFLEERPSVGLALFRFAVAGTVGLHVFPTLLQMEDNYLSTSFREYNASFFPVPILEWVAANPDGVVWGVAALFTLAWVFYLIGFLTPLSGPLLYLACYYFYARNSLHIGTLSWDMLLVVFFVMICTPFPGDSFSVDSLLRRSPAPWRRRRPFFIQRILQMMLASFYFYTALWKIWPEGNWLGDHPYYYLMHYPEIGVMKPFPGRSILAGSRLLCDGLEATILFLELTAPLWLFWRRTRIFAIGLGFFFHILLVVTMHVPTIFFFLFPPMLLLFLDPEKAAGWIQRRRERSSSNCPKLSD